MTLDDMEIFEAEVRHAVQARIVAKIFWEYWRWQIGRKNAEEIYLKLGEEGPADERER